MFTGIVERTATLIAATGGDEGRRLTIGVEESPGLPAWRDVELGESIAVNGVCLTAVDVGNRQRAGSVSFDVVPETLSKTTLGEMRPGDLVNIERSLRAGDPLGGHHVTGHVDGTGAIDDRETQGNQVLFWIAAPEPLLRQMLDKGSVAVDGISLTLVEVDRRRGRFSFAAVPHTLERTVLGVAGAGQRVNIETDAFGKWVLHALTLEGLSSPSGSRSRLEENERMRSLLERCGFLDTTHSGKFVG
ncbi:MAG: riboflavin synthase [Planctomycetota bacterium]|nr:riboflavin synthase [Planctomycetota bacterium]